MCKTFSVAFSEQNIDKYIFIWYNDAMGAEASGLRSSDKLHDRVNIRMVRHGKQFVYEESGSPLSPEGEEQARQFARNLADEFRGEEVIIKVEASPVEHQKQVE